MTKTIVFTIVMVKPNKNNSNSNSSSSNNNKNNNNSNSNSVKALKNAYRKHHLHYRQLFVTRNATHTHVNFREKKLRKLGPLFTNTDKLRN